MSNHSGLYGSTTVDVILERTLKIKIRLMAKNRG
jgi:hypothetical protein